MNNPNEDKNFRLYMFAMEVLNQPRIDKKMLYFKTFVNFIPKNLRIDNKILKILEEIKKYLLNPDKRAKINLLYNLMESPEESKLIFDERRKNDDSPVYRISSYPYEELIKIEYDIHNVIGFIIDNLDIISKTFDITNLLKKEKKVLKL